MITEELRASYLATEFHIQDSRKHFVLRIGEYSHHARQSPSANNSVFMTAHNPHSVLKSAAENNAANALLSYRIGLIPPRINIRDSLGTPGIIRVSRGFLEPR